jgi:hypothetical protein
MSLFAPGAARPSPTGRDDSAIALEEPEGVGMPVSRVGTGFAAAPEPGVVPESRVGVVESWVFGEVFVS